MNPRALYSQLLEQRRAEMTEREKRHRCARLCAAGAGGGGPRDCGGRAGYRTPVGRLGNRSRRGVCGPGRSARQPAARPRAPAPRGAYFESGLARLDGNWAGTGETGDRYLDPAHPYAQDLDLFGKGSLFELLCTARTHIGEDTLARWLLAPAAPRRCARARQAVEELRPRLDLREDLAVVAEEARTGVDPDVAGAWGEAPPLLAISRSAA